MSPKKYDPSKHHDALLDLPERARGQERKKYLKSSAQGNCSDCATQKKIGLVRQGEHIVWRQHWIKTWGNAVRQCRASGAPVCEAPARVIPGETPPKCPCGGPS
jgi:hypothetical protein